MKKYLVLTLALALAASSTKNTVAAPQHYLYTEMVADTAAGTAHAFRTASMKEINANVIKQRALIAGTTSILALIIKIISTVKANSHLEINSAWMQATLKLADDLIEAWNALRMYRNAENLATYNEKQSRSTPKLPQAQALLFSLLATNKLTKLGRTYGVSRRLTLDNESFFLKNYDKIDLIHLFSTLATALYEHGYYDAIKEIS